MHRDSFFKKGWIKFQTDPLLSNWVEFTLAQVKTIIQQKQHQHWLRCGGTWFAGVNILPNDVNGSVKGGPVLAGEAVDFIHQQLKISELNLDPGQISICYPGYPKPMPGESDSAFSYRLNRDAAHLDGLLPEGPQRRRHLREHHGFILGIPMVKSSPDASPLVIWEGSHERIRSALASKFSTLPCSHWGELDVTDIYQSTRRDIFEHCKRVEVFAEPGEAYLVHRLALHGVAPWKDNAWSAEPGRMICYFRPETDNPFGWLHNP